MTKTKRFHRLFLWWRNKIINNIYIDFSRASNTIFILGVPRGGTTWVSHLINYNNKYRYIFEPFHPHYCPYMHKYPVVLYQKPGSENDDLYQLFSYVLSGRSRSNWADRYNQKRIVTHRLVKSIHTHFILTWLHEKFPELPIIYVIRHPLGVVSSKLSIAENTPWKFYHSLDEVLKQKDLIENHLYSFLDILKIPKSNFEEEVLLWCLQNYVALRQLEKVPHKLVYYENVVERPFDELNRIQAFLNNNSKIINNRDFQKVYNKHFVPSGKPLSQSGPWKDQFNVDQLDYTSGTLKRFGLDNYYPID